MEYLESDWIYDLESYPNIFTMCIVNSSGTWLKVYEISDRKNDLEGLARCLRYLVKNRCRMVGFNNIGYDYNLIHHIIEVLREAKACKYTPIITAGEMYNITCKIIQGMRDDKWANTVRESDHVIKQVDLFKIHHFDNKAKATSLKMLEFNMRSDNIEDLPFPVGTVLNDQQKDVLIKYNKHDVLQTLKFYRESLDAIRFRQQLTEKYGFDCTNYNDTKIGKEYFINRLEHAMPGSCYTVKPHGGRSINQTKRSHIKLKDVVLPYVKFERPEFNALLEWFKSQTITETKGVFTDVLERDLGELAQYCQMVTKRKKFKTTPTEEERAEALRENPCAWIEEVELKSKKGAKSYWLNWNVAETLNVVVDGFRLDFGTGGIHGSLESQIVRSDDEWVIIDEDVASYYPNLAIANRVYPKHLGTKFCDIYQDVYNERKLYPKGSPENAVMKLALNGVYGDSNNQYSPFFDSQYTMVITINGQLSLCMLIEQLLKINELTMVQANTDGLTVRCKRKSQSDVDTIIKWWETTTKLSMERNDYSMMAIRDVNNYIAVYEGTGKVKRKGAYEYEGLGWHQNHSALVIPMAAEYELLGKGKVEEFITNHKNHWDFMLRTKVPRNSKLVMVMSNGAEIEQQNICRYYPSPIGGKLVKIMPPLEGKEEDGDRRLSIDKEWNVKTCNDITNFKWDIDYNYYFQEARKLVDPLIGVNTEST